MGEKRSRRRKKTEPQPSENKRGLALTKCLLILWTWANAKFGQFFQPCRGACPDLSVLVKLLLPGQTGPVAQHVTLLYFWLSRPQPVTGHNGLRERNWVWQVTNGSLRFEAKLQIEPSRGVAWPKNIMPFRIAPS